ncbi:DUF2829 domain-containing protein [Enterocloster clostridioformis]|uniref:DUF2829 domain-containing protein n=1 Tax=Enterocloster clostridioformis TaxID=1531 RepID=UPI000740636E|nr:DUF2829 domain-containing protein [Enterocloster clostridioformis]CUX75348.1 hypothetical protein BN3589_04576 [Clostridium sp. C105KSO14]
MKKLFISQPMKGKTDEEILVVREKAIESAREYLGEPVEVIDSFFQNVPADARPLWYLGKSLELLATADVAYFAPGWENARGCKIENTCAIEYGIDVIEDYAESEECLVSFGTAVEALKSGVKMTRKGWNGKGLFVVYQKGYPDGIPCNKQTAEAWGMKEGELFRCEPYLQINTVDGSHVMWVPSIRDVLAEDWLMVE